MKFESLYKELTYICKSMCKNDYVDDLIQDLAIEILDNRKIKKLTDIEQKRYIYSMAYFNYFSKNSKFYYKYKKNAPILTDNDTWLENKIEHEEDTTDKRTELNKAISNLKDVDWLMIDELLEENLNLNKLSKKANIPQCSLWKKFQGVKQTLKDDINRSIKN